MDQSTAVTRPITVASVNITGLNLRKDFDQDKLKELGENILAKGQLAPIIVRAMNGNGLYDLIAGERRLRAARLVGIEQLNATVLHITDEQAEELMIVENMQREDLHDLDYADGFAKMQSRGYSVAQLALKVNKGETFIRDLLSLAEIPEIARKAFRAGEIQKSHCVLIGTIPDAKQREAYAKDVLTMNRQPMTVKGAKEWKAQHYMRDLSSAPFPLEDATLDPEWTYTCTKGSCPYWNGNTPENRQGKRPNICLNPPHYTELVRRQGQRMIAKAMELDRLLKVIPPSEAKNLFYPTGGLTYNCGYANVSDADVHDYRPGKSSVKASTIIKQVLVNQYLATDPKGNVVTLVKKKALETAAKTLGIQTSYSQSNTAADKAAATKKREDNAVKRAIAGAVFEQLERTAAKGFIFATTARPIGQLLGLAKHAVRNAPGAVGKFLCERLELKTPKTSWGGPDWQKALLKDLAAPRMARGRPAYLWSMLACVQVFSQLNEYTMKEWGRSKPNADDIAMCAAFGIDLKKIEARLRVEIKAKAKAAKGAKKRKA